MRGNITKEQIAYLTLIILCAALVAAWISEYVFALVPCSLCFYQRYLYITAAGILSLYLFVLRGRHSNLFLLLTGLILLTCAGFAAYQVAIENHWVELPKSCKTYDPVNSLEELKTLITSKSAVACDKVQWSLFGLSMAGYNFLLALALSILCFSGIYARDKQKKKFARR